MTELESAARLESLVPQVVSILFYSGENDPLRHHSVGQIRLMRTLLGGSKSASELSNMLGLSPSSLTQMASRMIRAGLVSKRLDKEDRRVRVLSLTPAGQALMEGRQAVRVRAAAQLLEKMHPERLEMLIGILEEIKALQSERSVQFLEAKI